MIKRAVPKPPRVFVLKPRALGADPTKPLSSLAPQSRPLEAETTRVEVVQSRVGRVRAQAGPRAS